jgi:multidrug efflux pump subunit AcrA (membrane-fusion protein)
MKSPIFLTASGFALCAFLALPAAAQQANPGQGAHLDANGMPTNQSTPEEQAQTSQLNQQSAGAAAEANSQAASADAQYQAQQQEYQEQLRQNQQAQQDYQNRKAQYDAQASRYEGLRARFAAERAQYHRQLWPNEYRSWELRPDYQVLHARVEITNGDHVGTVTGLARDPYGRIEGLDVALDSGKQVWIDASDARFNRADGILMTDLDRQDLHEMAEEKL